MRAHSVDWHTDFDLLNLHPERKSGGVGSLAKGVLGFALSGQRRPFFLEFKESVEKALNTGWAVVSS